MTDHQIITAERGRRAEDLRAAAIAALEQQSIASGVMLDLDSDKVVAAGPKAAILMQLNGDDAPAATSGGELPTDLEALALAYVYEDGDHWYSHSQIADGITYEPAANFIARCTPAVVLDLLARIERAAAPAPIATALPDELEWPERSDHESDAAFNIRAAYVNGWNGCRLFVSRNVERAAAPTDAELVEAFPERDLRVPAEEQGLFRKFDVRRTDGSSEPGEKHHGCRYFVLDLNHDQHAPAAMRAYAAACRATHPYLADDIETEFGSQRAVTPAWEQYADIVRIQRREAEADPSDGYMHGLYNGIVMMCSNFDGITYPMMEAPERAAAPTDAAIPKGCAVGSNGVTYHNIEEIYHQFEQCAALHIWLDEKGVPRADDDGRVLSPVGRVVWMQAPELDHTFDDLAGRGLHELRIDELPAYLAAVANNHGARSEQFTTAAQWVASELERKTNDERVLAVQLCNLREASQRAAAPVSGDLPNIEAERSLFEASEIAYQQARHPQEPLTADEIAYILRREPQQRDTYAACGGEWEGWKRRAAVAASQAAPVGGELPSIDTPEFRAVLRQLLTAHNQMVNGPAGEALVSHIDGKIRAEVAAAKVPTFDFHAHLARQAAWSRETFGPGPRTAGVCDHIRKELREIEADPTDLREWIDVVILALDGAWRCGGSPEQIIDGIVAKQTKNEGRNWPDWRTADPNRAIEHDRSGEVAAPVEQGQGADSDSAWKTYAAARTPLLDTSHNRAIFAAGFSAGQGAGVVPEGLRIAVEEAASAGAAAEQTQQEQK